MLILRSARFYEGLTILAISIGLLTASQATDKLSFHTKSTPSRIATE